MQGVCWEQLVADVKHSFFKPFEHMFPHKTYIGRMFESVTSLLICQESLGGNEAVRSWHWEQFRSSGCEKGQWETDMNNSLKTSALGLALGSWLEMCLLPYSGGQLPRTSLP